MKKVQKKFREDPGDKKRRVIGTVRRFSEDFKGYGY
jgi:hypothetical protein